MNGYYDHEVQIPWSFMEERISFFIAAQDSNKTKRGSHPQLSTCSFHYKLSFLKLFNDRGTIVAR